MGFLSPGEVVRKALRPTPAPKPMGPYQKAKGGHGDAIGAAVDAVRPQAVPPPVAGSTPSRPGTGRVGGTGGTPSVEPPSLEDSAKAALASAQTNMGSAYDDAIAAVNDAYARAAKGRVESLRNQTQPLADSASNLGIDFVNSDVARKWDAENRMLQEAADLALANDLAYFEKARAAEQSTYEALQTMLDSGVLGMVGGGGGGGGGGRRGGRRGGRSFSSNFSDGPVEETLNEEIESLWPEFTENLGGSGLTRDQMAQALEVFDAGRGSPVGFLEEITNRMGDAREQRRAAGRLRMYDNLPSGQTPTARQQTVSRTFTPLLREAATRKVNKALQDLAALQAYGRANSNTHGGTTKERNIKTRQKRKTYRDTAE